MRNAVPIAFFVALAMVNLLGPVAAVAQNPADPLNPFGGEGIDFRQLAPAEPTPEVALPGDPAAAGVLVLPGAAGAPVGKSDDLCRCVGEESSAESVARIRKALQSPLKKSGIEFTEQPLQEVVSFLQDDYGIPIKIDGPALDEASIQPDKPVTVNIHRVTLGAALRLMLRELNLTSSIQDEVLLITTPSAEEERIRTCVYDVRDLLADSKKGNDFDSLIDPIVSCVATETWAENGGGESEIRPLHPGFLIIAQTEPVHEQIRGLLATIRELKSRQSAASANAAHVPMQNNEIVTKAYRLNFGNTPVTDELRSEVRALILRALSDERWEGRLGSGEPVVLSVLNDRVVVRHRPDVQEKVEELLVDSGLAAQESANWQGCRGGGGTGGLANTAATPAQQ